MDPDPAGPTALGPDPRLIATPADFARALRVLRQRAGLSLRGVAAALGGSNAVPVATLADWFSGTHLPTPSAAKTLTQLLQALGQTDPVDVGEWLAALERVRVPPGPRPSTAAPFRGLACYEPEHAGLFHGRDGLVAELLELVAVRHGRGLPTVVVGPSGSGKSSLVRAGLIPALAAGSSGLCDAVLRHLVLTPGRDPMAELAVLREAATDTPLLVVVDQLEELFTSGADEADRRSFVQTLCQAAAEPAAPVIVVFVLRADFYTQALQIPELAEAGRGGQLIVGPMSEPELRRVLTEPARSANIALESGLVELLLREMAPAGGTDGGHDPGALPLLSHALLATWEAGRRRTLTVEHYLATGGIQGAIAKTAEDAYDALTESQKEAARALFLRLVRSTPDSGDTRRRISDAEAAEILADSADTAAVLDQFVVARLLTVDEHSIGIAHEALVGAWPRLRSWLDADRAWLRLRDRLTVAAQEWVESGRDPETLDRGPLLQLTRTWAEERGHRNSLTAVEREFLTRSIGQVEAAKDRERRRTRRRSRLIALFVVLLALSGSVAAYGRQQQVTRDREQSQALSRLVADESNRLRDHNVTLSMQLALAAYDIAPTQEALSSVLDSTGICAETTIGPASGVDSEAFTVAGSLVAVGTAKGQVRLVRFAANKGPEYVGAPLPVSGDAVVAVASDRAGNVLAAAGKSGELRVWMVSDTRHPTLIADLPSGGAAPTALALSPNGQMLAEGTAAGTVALWAVSDLVHATRPAATLHAFSAHVDDLTFSPDSSLLAAAGYDFSTSLWRVTRADTPQPLDTVKTPTTRIFSVAFSPDGRTLAGGAAAGHEVYLWDVTDPTKPWLRGQPLSGPTSWVNSVAFSPDGRSLAAGSSDGQLWLFDVASGRSISQLPHPQPVSEVRYLADGTPLTLTVDDGVLHQWHVPGPVLTGAADSVFDVEFGSDGHRLVIAPGAADNTVTLWDTSSVHQPRALGAPITGLPDPAKFSGSAAFSADGGNLYLGTLNGYVQHWDVADPPHPNLTGSTATATDLIESLSLDPAGHLLAVASDDGTVHLVNVADAAHPIPVAGIALPSKVPVYQAVFSSNGKLLAAASEDHQAYLYDVSTPARPTLLAALGGFSSAAYSVTFDGSGRLMAVGSADSTVGLWNVTDPRHPVSVGRRLVGPIGYAYALAFAPGRDVLAVGANEDGQIWMWDVHDPAHPTQVATLSGPAGGVISLAYGPDGASLVAGGVNHTVQLWDADLADARSWICSNVGEGITPTLWAQYVPGADFHAVCPGAALK